MAWKRSGVQFPLAPLRTSAVARLFSCNRGFPLCCNGNLLVWLLVCYVISYLSEHADGVWFGSGNRSKSVECVCGGFDVEDCCWLLWGYAWFKSSIPYWFGVHGIAVVSMWRRMLRRHNDEPMAFLEGSSENICQQFIDVRLERIYQINSSQLIWS